MSAPAATRPDTPEQSADSGGAAYLHELYDTALVQPPRLSDRPEKTRPQTSLWRLRKYMYPFLGRFAWMLFFSAAGIACGMLIPLVTGAVIDGPIAGHDRAGILAMGLGALSLGIAEAVLLFGRRWITGRYTMGMEAGIRLEMHARLQKLPMAFHARWQSGQLLSRMMTDLGVVRRFLSFGLVFLLTSTVQIAAVIILLLSMYWPLGVIVLISIIPVVYVVMKNQRAYVKLSRKIQDQTGDVASSVEEGIQGLRVVKAFGRRDHMVAKFDERADALYETSMKRVQLTSKFWTFLAIIPGITMILVLGAGAFAAAQHAVTLGTLVAFINLLLLLVGPVTQLGNILSMMQDAMTAADRVCDIFDSELTIVGGPTRLGRATGRLEFDNVSFQFPDGDHDVLHDINLTLEPGETLALVGGTGSGKSTMTGLVARLYDVTGGSILLDGHDIRDLDLIDLRTNVATAFEEPTLFSMSARENLTLGNPDATDEEVARAVDIAQAHFVYDLPWGLDTRIGEQGMSLSGGQRQRLALARAVLVEPTVLVLDDTLSALDIHTEALVEEALGSVLGHATSIVVAHRASTVMLADRVALLQEGTITHVGTHSDLLANVPAYRELLSAEFDPEQELADERVGDLA